MNRRIGLVLLAVLTLAACGDDDGGARVEMEHGKFVTVEDELTGRLFRCLYIDGFNASDLLCYEPVEGEPP